MDIPNGHMVTEEEKAVKSVISLRKIAQAVMFCLSKGIWTKEGRASFLNKPKRQPLVHAR